MNRLYAILKGSLPLLCLLLSLLACFPALAQTDKPGSTTVTSYKAQTRAILSSMSTSGMTSNILYDRVFPLADLEAYTGQAGAEASKSEHFFQAYYELYNANNNAGSMQTNEQIRNQVADNDGANTYPIGLIYYNYDDIKPSAVDDNLLRYQNEQFVDVPGRSQHPYRSLTAFVASPLLHQNAPIYKPGVMTFRLDPAFFFINTGASIQYCQIDFQDGGGVRTLYPNGSVQINYPTAGKRTLTIKAVTTTNQQLQAYAEVSVLDATVSNNSYDNWTDNDVCNQGPTVVPITGYSFDGSQYKAGEGVESANGTGYILFAKGNCQSRVLRKPIVFLDGFDPADTRDYKTIYKNFINGEDRGDGSASLKLGDKLRNDGYDIIILDFEHGGNYIERNGLVLVKLLEQLWSTYSSTIEKDFVVIGPSMGALVAQYGLAEAERRNINTHTRLYISFDGPHRGANVPIGLQQLIGYGLQSKIAEPEPGCRGYTSGTPGYPEDGFPLNVRSAKQMLFHHYLANSETPKPHPFRDRFVQNMAVVGYPKKCRKIAVINGSRQAITQKAGYPNQTRDLVASEDIIRLELESKAANFFLTSDKSLLSWGSTSSPVNGQGNTFHAFTSTTVKKLLKLKDKIHDDYARPYAFATSTSVDLLPGGYTDFTGLIIKEADKLKGSATLTFGRCINIGVLESPFGAINFNFLLRLNVILREGRNYSVTTNAPIQSFIPTTSAVDFNNATTLTYNFNSENLTCTGKTPFDQIYAPAENQAHVAVTVENAAWFENEIKQQNIPESCRCDFTPVAAVSGNNYIPCGGPATLVANCNGADCNGITYSWSLNNTAVGSGSSVNVTAPSSNGQYNYILSGNRLGCATKTSIAIVNVNDCPTTPTCDFNLTPTVSNANPGCGSNINLGAGCTGGDCGSATFTWTLNGTNVATGASPTVSAPGSNNGYTYTVSASKSGCTTKTNTVAITVSNCPTTPTTICVEAESGVGNRTPESNGGASGGQFVGGFGGAGEYMDYAINGVASAGNYTLTL